MGRRGPKSWTTTEQESFLMEQLPEYIRCQPSRQYEEFMSKTNFAFLAKWPERACLHQRGIPAEGSLTDQQNVILQDAIKARKTVSYLMMHKITRKAQT